MITEPKPGNTPTTPCTSLIHPVRHCQPYLIGAVIGMLRFKGLAQGDLSGKMYSQIQVFQSLNDTPPKKISFTS